MCRSLTVLCAAASSERLAELKRAVVSVHWELVGGATSLSELLLQVKEFDPDVVVLHAGFSNDAVEAVRRIKDRVRVVAVGDVPEADERADSLHVLREAILGLPRPGGPVRS